MPMPSISGTVSARPHWLSVGMPSKNTILDKDDDSNTCHDKPVVELICKGQNSCDTSLDPRIVNRPSE